MANEIVVRAKKHPYVAVGVIGVGIGVIVLLRKGGGGSSNVAAVGTVAAANAQYNQLQAGLSVAQSQAGAQVQAAQIAATAQQRQIDAAAGVQNTQTEAQLIAALAQNQTNARSNELSADVLNNQNHSAATVASQQIQAELDALTNTNDTQLKAFTQQVQYETAVAQNQYQLSSTVLDAVQKAGLDHPINEVTALSSLSEAAIGAYGPSIATTQTGSTLAAASASKFASVAGAISNGLSSVLAAL